MFSIWSVFWRRKRRKWRWGSVDDWWSCGHLRANCVVSFREFWRVSGYRFEEWTYCEGKNSWLGQYFDYPKCQRIQRCWTSIFFFMVGTTVSLIKILHRWIWCCKPHTIWCCKLRCFSEKRWKAKQIPTQFHLTICKKCVGRMVQLLLPHYDQKASGWRN